MGTAGHAGGCQHGGTLSALWLSQSYLLPSFPGCLGIVKVAYKPAAQEFNFFFFLIKALFAYMFVKAY